MAGWKKYPENKPPENIWCLVVNDKCPMVERRAIYMKEYGIFSLLDALGLLPIEVTHYFEMPDFPSSQEDEGVNKRGS